jgi:3-hydroxyisobutyrate dehydrogenase-like beta-hydroxyacid dehydrogenase
LRFHLAKRLRNAGYPLRVYNRDRSKADELVSQGAELPASTPAAAAGSVTLFGGGERQAFDLLTRVFPAIARQWFYMGPSGSEMAMKLVGNPLQPAGCFGRIAFGCRTRRGHFELGAALFERMRSKSFRIRRSGN